MKKVLITGANSYIGESLRKYLLEFSVYTVDVKDTIGWTPVPNDFVGYDVVFNVAGIAHIKETKKNAELYYRINRDLVIRIAEAAKEGGVKQFILLSTMSVYGLLEGHIKKNTPTNPINAYGKSKVEADEIIAKLEDDSFKFACIRPPMVYGHGCKGNYQNLRRFAIKSPFFPDFPNRRSMIFIDNLCEFVKETIDQEKRGLFFPQNGDYTSTSQMVYLVSSNNGKSIRLTKAFNWAIRIFRIRIIKKVFGDLTYEPVDLVDKISFEDSIRLTENGASNNE